MTRNPRTREREPSQVVDAVPEEAPFALGPVTLEFAIDGRPAAEGRVRVSVPPTDVKESASPESLHRLKVILEPVNREPVKSRGQMFSIGGSAGGTGTESAGLGGDRPGD